MWFASITSIRIASVLVLEYRIQPCKTIHMNLHTTIGSPLPYTSPLSPDISPLSISLSLSLSPHFYPTLNLSSCFVFNSIFLKIILDFITVALLSLALSADYSMTSFCVYFPTPAALDWDRKPRASITSADIEPNKHSHSHTRKIQKII